MKLLSLIVLCILPFFVFCQGSPSKWSLDFEAGVNKADMRNGPVNLLLCYEGCTAVSQTGLPAINLAIGGSYKFSKNQSASLSVQYNQHRFYEKILDGFSGSVYSIDNSMAFIGLRLAHNLDFFSVQKTSFFIKNGFQLDIPNGGLIYTFKNFNPAYSTNIGFRRRINHKFNAQLGLTFKTALADYLSDEWDDTYLPYTFGISTAINMNL